MAWSGVVQDEQPPLPSIRFWFDPQLCPLACPAASMRQRQAKGHSCGPYWALVAGSLRLNLAANHLLIYSLGFSWLLY